MKGTSSHIVAVVFSVLGSCAVAHAQSAADGFEPGANGNVYAVVLQPDGKILVGGAFTGLGGGTGTTTRNHLGRLNPDGSLDPSFNPNADGEVYAFVVQPDGKILVGGSFTTLGGATRHRIGRLNADGSLDNDFDPDANDAVYGLAVQPDGKILVGGLFSTLGGATRNRIGRLNAGGSLDASFDPGANDFVYSFVVQPGGRILVGGAFTMLGGGGLGLMPRNRIARLNADGSLDGSFNPGANDWVIAAAVQPDGKILVGGNFSRLGGGGTGVTLRRRIGRLNPDGSLDDLFDTGANETVYAVRVQPDRSILVGGNFRSLESSALGQVPLNRIARLYADNSIDATFNRNADGSILAMAVQADGKVLVGGSFSVLGFPFVPPGVNARNRIGRINAEGSLDPSFNPGADNVVYALAAQPDGKILVGGAFTRLGGGGIGKFAREHLGRLNADGSLDNIEPRSNDWVLALVMQPDGKILVGGFFTMLGGPTGLIARNHLGRLNADGSLDGFFNPGANGYVDAFAVQPDGKILVGGDFTMLGNGATTTRSHLARLNADGSLDNSFDPGANGMVQTVAVQPDGKILVGGDFTMLGGGGTGTTPRSRIGRLNADGSLDDTFNPGANDAVDALAVQADGRILVAGAFTALSDVATGFHTRNRIGRFTADGSLDATFDPGADSRVSSLAVQADGKVLAGGYFTTLGGGGTGTSPRERIGRLTNTGRAIQSLSVTGGGGGVTWSRSGTGPEVSHVTFESWAGGASYTPLGSGTRVAGGWLLSGLSLPARQNLYIRARGFYGTGVFTGSDSIVESIMLKTYQLFSDDPLTAGSSPIRVVHITELRTRIDVQRVRFGLAAFSWTPASLAAGMTAAAVHVTELRTALQEAYTAGGQPAPAFTESPLVPASTSIKVVHIQQLRDAVIVLEAR